MTPRVRLKDSRFIAVTGAENLELNTQTGVYYVRKYKAGKGELFKSTRCKKKLEAKAIADEMIAAWLGMKGRVQRRVRVSAVIDDLLEYYRALHESLDEFGRPRRRTGTWKHDQAFLKLLNQYFGDYFIDEIDEQFWETWVEETGRGLNRTLADVGKYLSLIMAHAFRRKVTTHRPKIKNPDKYKSKAVVYEDSQILVFIKHSDPMLKDMIILAAENPLRPHEVREMRWEFLTFPRRGGVILRLPSWFTKTDKDREMELSANASQMLRTRRKAVPSSSPVVFPSPTKPEQAISTVIFSIRWRAMLKRAGITKPAKFHWLRHSVYSKLLLDAKIPVQHVSEAGGTSIGVLQRRYLKSDHTRTRMVGQAISLKLKGDEEE